MRDRNKKKQPNWLGLAVVFLLVAPEITISVAICAGIGYLVYILVKNSRIPTHTKKQTSFDDCPKPLFCFHKDKGEHHVRRGKEIDPWDRPDIDISKYQKRQ